MSLWVNYRPDHLPPRAAMSLNAETAAPEEREAQHLAPKSFADAAHEALEPQSHANGTDGAAEHAEHADHVATNGGHKSNGVSVLRIVDVDGDGHHDDDKKSAAESTQQSSKESSIRDQESYEGTGIDETPKSPKAKSHRRKSSRSSLGSIGRTYGVSMQNDLKTAANDAASEAADSAADEAAHVKKAASTAADKVTDQASGLKKQLDGAQETLTRTVNEAKEELDGSLLQEKPRLVNGNALTTVKPPREAEQERRIDKPMKRRNSELKAGRQAGAGWAQSKYVQHTLYPPS